MLNQCDHLAGHIKLLRGSLSESRVRHPWPSQYFTWPIASTTFFVIQLQDYNMFSERVTVCPKNVCLSLLYSAGYQGHKAMNQFTQWQATRGRSEPESRTHKKALSLHGGWQQGSRVVGNRKQKKSTWRSKTQLNYNLTKSEAAPSSTQNE